MLKNTIKISALTTTLLLLAGCQVYEYPTTDGTVFSGSPMTPAQVQADITTNNSASNFSSGTTSPVVTPPAPPAPAPNNFSSGTTSPVVTPPPPPPAPVTPGTFSSGTTSPVTPPPPPPAPVSGGFSGGTTKPVTPNNNFHGGLTVKMGSPQKTIIKSPLSTVEAR